MNKLLKLFVCLGIMGISQQANAAGFALIEQSVSNMGTAYAGAAANAEDATTIWFNPAGMTRFCDSQIVVGAQPVFPRAVFKDRGSHLAPALGGAPLTGNNGGNGGDFGVVPSTYFVYPTCEPLVFGLGINSPYGLTTSYHHHWKGRYYARHSKIFAININPSVAWKICENVSFGAGFNAQYFRATLTNDVDFGSILFAATQGGLGVPQGLDGEAKLKGDCWGYGGNAGVLWDINYSTSVGLNYRSEIRQKLTGHVRYKGVPGPLAGTFQDARARATIRLPQTVSLSAVHHMDCRWDVMADITWTNWNRLKNLTVKFDSPQPDNVTPFKWKNVFRYSLGTTYKYYDCLKLRCGVAYDQGPTPNAEYRNPRLPDTNRFWLAVGFGYDVNCIHIDFGYAHLFIEDPKIHKNQVEPGQSDFFLGDLNGKYHENTDIVGLQLVYNF